MKIELERHQLISLMLACDAADSCSSPDTKKWKKLHVQLMHVLLEYDSDIDSAANAGVRSRKVYKLERGEQYD